MGTVVTPASPSQIDFVAAIAALTPGSTFRPLPTTYGPLTQVVTFPAGVNYEGNKSMIRCGVGGRFHIPEADSEYRNLWITGTNKAETPLLIGTGPGGAGANALFQRVLVSNAAAGAPAVIGHNQQNTTWIDFRIRSNELTNGMLLTDGSKNNLFYGFWPSRSLDWCLKIDTDGGTQRTSKTRIYGGLSESAEQAAVVLGDCEDTTLGGFTMNGDADAPPPAAIQCVTNSARTGSARGPDRIGLGNCYGRSWGALVASAVDVDIWNLGGNQVANVDAMYALTPGSRIVQPGDADW